MAVTVMSGSVTADGAVLSSDSAQELTADDFATTFSANPSSVVLGPDGSKTSADYRIVIRHPRTIDDIGNLRLVFRKGMVDPWHPRPNSFRMSSAVVEKPSAGRTVLNGHSNFWGRWRSIRLRAHPGYYTARNVRVVVIDGDETTTVKVVPPSGGIRVRYESRTVLRDPKAKHDRVVISGNLQKYAGGLQGGDGDQWTSTGRKRVQVMFLRRGASEPRVVATTSTNRDGQYSVLEKNHGPGRWWVQFPGDRHLAASRSTGRFVGASDG